MRIPNRHGERDRNPGTAMWLKSPKPLKGVTDNKGRTLYAPDLARREAARPPSFHSVPSQKIPKSCLKGAAVAAAGTAGKGYTLHWERGAGKPPTVRQTCAYMCAPTDYAIFGALCKAPPSPSHCIIMEIPAEPDPGGGGGGIHHPGFRVRPRARMSPRYQRCAHKIFIRLLPFFLPFP